MKKLSGMFLICNVKVTFDGETKGNRSHPLVCCPICGSERRVNMAYISLIRRGKSSGLCATCNSRAMGKNNAGFKKVTDEILPSGSVIHWGERISLVRGYVTCGKCQTNRITTISRKKGWTGFCPKCAVSLADQHPNWTGAS